MRYKKELTLLMISIIICLVFFELFVRMIDWPVPMKNDYPVGMTSPDSTKGFALTSNFKGYFPGTNISISINSKGLRDYEHEYKKPKNVTRILVLGDSVTFGSGLDYQDIYVTLIESNLNSTRKMEVIKTGVGGYEFSQQESYYREEGYKYEPDIVMIGLVLNDLNTPDIDQIRKNFETYGSDMKKDSKNRAFIKTVCHSCVFMYSTLFNYNKIYSDIIYEKWENEKIFQVYSQRLLNLKKDLDEDNIKLVVVAFPYNWQFENFKQNFRKDYLPQQRMMDLALKNNFTFIDLAPRLDKPEYEDYYIPYDNVHLNPKGNVIVTEKILEVLKEEGIV